MWHLSLKDCYDTSFQFNSQPLKYNRTLNISSFYSYFPFHWKVRFLYEIIYNYDWFKSNISCIFVWYYLFKAETARGFDIFGILFVLAAGFKKKSDGDLFKLQKAALKRPSLYTICMWLARWKINVNTSALTGCYQHFTEPTITLTDNLLELRGKYTPYIWWSFSLNGDKDMDRILRKHVVSKELFEKLHFLLEMTLIRMRQCLGLNCLRGKV